MSVRNGVVATFVALATLTGCTHSRLVSLTAPTPTGSSVTQCNALLAKLTGSVGSLARRELTASSPFAAAWGDPVTTMRCGVATMNLDPTASQACVARVTWRVRQAGDVAEWVTENRETTVEVRVPLSNRAQESVMTDIGNAVHDAIPEVPTTTVGPCPSPSPSSSSSGSPAS